MNLCSINLKFGDQVIFSNFSYCFHHTGLYLLYGPSGSGKTTLLNILMGQQEIDSGEYFYSGQLFHHNLNETLKDFSYFTQTSYFLDYLTVRENLQLCSNDNQKIMFWLEYFNINHLYYKYPKELSGGERQRLSLIIGLLQNKKVFLLDEPTSNLDKQQSISIFECLHDLSKNVCIIFVSHDSKAKEYCDEIIDFTKLNNDQIITPSTQRFENEDMYQSHSQPSNYLKLFISILKNHYPLQFTIIVFFTICSILLFSVVEPEMKIRNYLINNTNLNYLKLYVNSNAELNLDELINLDGIISSVYSYKDNISSFTGEKLTIDDIENGFVDVNENILKTASYGTLPYKKDDLFCDLSLYAGTYFSDTYSVLVGYDYASRNFQNPINAVGQIINIETSFGIQQFMIVGVLHKFDDQTLDYLSSGIIQRELADELIYFNSTYSMLFRNDHLLSDLEKSVYHYSVYDLYFDNTTSLIDFLNEFGKNSYGSDVYVKDPIEYKLDTFLHLERISSYIIPITFLLVSILIGFYLFTNWIYLSYNS